MASLLNISDFTASHSRHHLIQTRDLDKAYEFISANVVPYRYHCLDKGWENDRAALVHNYANLDDLEVIYINYGRKVVIQADPLDDYLFQVAHTGNCEVSCAGKQIQLNGNQCSIISPGAPYQLKWSQDCSIFEIKIRKALMERVFKSMTGYSVDQSILFDIEFNRETQLINYISSSLSYICSMIEEENVTTHHRHSIKSLGLSILTMILENQPNNHTIHLQNAKPNTPKHVQKAVEFMQAHFARQLTLAQIADAADTCTRNLNLCFQKHCNSSPMEFLKAIRLDCAHRLLKKASVLETQVTKIALDCGFNHMGRFSSDYQKRFGELPSQSLKSFYM